MPVVLSTVSRYRSAGLLLVALCAACSGLPEQQPDNRYQRAIESDAAVVQPQSGPVRQLQNQALAAINEDQYALAIDYLQRAIKIQPRDAWGDRARCLAMLERSQSYATGDDRLDDANAALYAQCR